MGCKIFNYDTKPGQCFFYANSTACIVSLVAGSIFALIFIANFFPHSAIGSLGHFKTGIIGTALSLTTTVLTGGVIVCLYFKNRNRDRTITITGKVALIEPENAGYLGSNPENLSIFDSQTAKVRVEDTNWTEDENEILIKCQIFATNRSSPVIENTLHLPFSLFINNDDYLDYKADGDIIEFMYEKVRFRLTLSQEEESQCAFSDQVDRAKMACDINGILLPSYKENPDEDLEQPILENPNLQQEKDTDTDGEVVQEEKTEEKLEMSDTANTLPNGIQQEKDSQKEQETLRQKFLEEFPTCRLPEEKLVNIGYEYRGGSFLFTMPLIDRSSVIRFYSSESAFGFFAQPKSVSNAKDEEESVCYLFLMNFEQKIAGRKFTQEDFNRPKLLINKGNLKITPQRKQSAMSLKGQVATEKIILEEKKKLENGEAKNDSDTLQKIAQEENGEKKSQSVERAISSDLTDQKEVSITERKETEVKQTEEKPQTGEQAIALPEKKQEEELTGPEKVRQEFLKKFPKCKLPEGQVIPPYSDMTATNNLSRYLHFAFWLKEPLIRDKSEIRFFCSDTAFGFYAQPAGESDYYLFLINVEEIKTNRRLTQADFVKAEKILTDGRLNIELKL